ncbi:MAG: PepSY domain-containing protein [Xanthobacteraceae bacterium]|nr:PepSY domain-containing protein [Xanthobacteraceae bacterium]
MAQWIRWIHEGSNSGVIWQVLVFLCGVLPTGFAITGTMIWLRGRKAKAAVRSGAAVPQMDAAE